MKEIMAPKADAAFATTASLSGLNLWLYNANAWFSQNMPLVSGMCLIISTLAAIWYYWQMRRQRIKDRELEIERMNRQERAHSDSPGG